MMTIRRRTIELSSGGLVLLAVTIIVITAIVIIIIQIDYYNNSESDTVGHQSIENNYRPTSTTLLSTKQLDDIPNYKVENVVEDIQNLPSSSSSSLLSSSSFFSLTNIFKKVENSVVQITTKVSSSNRQTIIDGNPLEGQTATRLGSGFVYDNQGHIITNDHVIGEAKAVDVTFVDGNAYTAKVIGTDPFGDIAVLQITDNNFPEEHVNPLPIANSSILQVGQQVIAIGNPFGLSGTMTTGIVSQIGRLLPNPDTGFSIPNGIQTDAPINPGSSGGPLLDMQGQVIGVNTAIGSSTGTFSGIGFAIPSNAIAQIVPALIQKGRYSHPWLGISGGSITPDLAQSNGLPRNLRGVVVASVEANSPADKAGLQAMSGQNILNSITQIGDIITAIDGQPVKRIDDIINYMEVKKSVGDTVKLTVNRGGKTMDLNAVLQGRPNSLPLQQSSQQQERQQQPFQSPDQSKPPSPSPNSPRSLFSDLYNGCVMILGKWLCDPLFGK